jgi:hypothetical protein
MPTQLFKELKADLYRVRFKGQTICKIPDPLK